MLEGLIVVVVAGVGLAGLAGTGLISSGAARTGVALAGAVAALLVIVGLGLAVGRGVDGGVGGEREAEAPTTTTSVTPGPVPLRAPTLVLRAPRAERPPSPARAVGDLADGELVVVAIDAPEPLRTGTVHQCPTGAIDPADCRDGLPITTDDRGRARALLDLRDRFDSRGRGEVDCRDDLGCSLVFFGPTRLEVRTIFDGPAPPAVRVEAQPAQVEEGVATRTVARNVPPGARVTFALCRWSTDERVVSCGARSVPTRADARGLASGEVLVDGDACGRGESCFVAVAVEDGDPVAFGFLRVTGAAGAVYDDGRLTAGLAAAALLLLGAAWLLRRTDWTPVDGDPFRDVVLPDDPFEGVDEPSPA